MFISIPADNDDRWQGRGHPDASGEGLRHHHHHRRLLENGELVQRSVRQEPEVLSHIYQRGQLKEHAECFIGQFELQYFFAKSYKYTHITILFI